MTTLILLIIMGVIFATYITAIVINYGVQPSVSESYYRLPDKWKPLFTFATWGYAAPATVIGLQLTGSPLFFLAGLAIMFVGASPAFRASKAKQIAYEKAAGKEYRSLEPLVHFIGATVGITAAMVAVWVTLSLWWLVVLFLVASAATGLYTVKTADDMSDMGNLYWWIEIYAFVVLWVAFLIRA